MRPSREKTSVDQAVPYGEADEFVDAVEVEFFHDAATMCVYRVDAQIEYCGDLFIGLALGVWDVSRQAWEMANGPNDTAVLRRAEPAVNQ